MAIVSKVIEPMRGLGRERLTLLGALTGGHTAIHWFQQIFILVVPQVTIALGLSPFQVGVIGAARQVGNLMTLPSGILADSWVRRRAIMLENTNTVRIQVLSVCDILCEPVQQMAGVVFARTPR